MVGRRWKLSGGRCAASSWPAARQPPVHPLTDRRLDGLGREIKGPCTLMPEP